MGQRERAGIRHLAAACVLGAALAVPVAGEAADSGDVRSAIADLVRNEAALPPALGGGGVHQRMADVYAARAHAPIWLQGNPDRAMALIAALRNADAEGLRPAAYRPDALAAAVQESTTSHARARTDLRLSAAFLAYADDLRRGRITAGALGRPEAARPSEAHGLQLLAAAGDRVDVTGFLAELAPDNAVYRDLRDALARYRALADQGGWPEVSTTKTLKAGMADPAVRDLRKRLAVTGDLEAADSETADTGAGESESAAAPSPASDVPETGAPETVSAEFDARLDAAVREFQSRHGLDTDGIVGPRTRRALNVPAAARIEQIVVNMERSRWLPEDLGERAIHVNIAGFKVDVMREGEQVLSMNAIVGTRYRKTPVFSGRMTYLEVNPTWTLPPTIFREDILPKLRENPSYLAEQDMTLYAGWQADSAVLDPTTVDWSRVSAKHLPYRIVQAPGPANPLGRIKFMFPNKHHVYLHDTPGREKFRRAERSFSSGCIRVEKPYELAATVLGDGGDADRERITKLIDSGQTKRVSLPEPWPVHLTYATVWRGRDGSIQFRNDIYDRDARLSRLLDTAHTL